MSKKSNIQKALEDIDSIQENEPIMIAGSLLINKKTFNKYYKPLLNKIIEKKGRIHVGCAKGCDTLVQEYCIENEYFNLTVFIPSKALATSTETATETATETEISFLNEKFTKIIVDGGFGSRDKKMRVGCIHIVGFVSQYAGAASGTAANIISLAAKRGLLGPECVNLEGYRVVEILRDHCVDFNQGTLNLVLSFESPIDN
ncbi:MAG: hypothetical protein WD512_11805 [Candidatus Paceibacterota bacterium]